MRAAIGGDFIGSRFERSVWSGDWFPEVCCAGYDVADPRVDCRGESAGDFALLHADCFITDDSALTIAVMDWLIHPGELRSLLRAYYHRTGRPELFGKVFRDWAESDTKQPGQGAGNGAAMRVSPVAFVADTPEAVLQLARDSAVVTHAVPDAIAGA